MIAVSGTCVLAGVISLVAVSTSGWSFWISRRTRRRLANLRKLDDHHP